MDNDLDRSVRLLNDTVSFRDKNLLRRAYSQMKHNNLNFSVSVNPEELQEYLENETTVYNDTFRSILAENKTLTGSVIRTHEPFLKTMDSLYLEFFEIMQMSGDSNNVMGMIAEMARCCSDALNIVKGLKSKVAYGGTSPEEWLENERNTWRLIFVLYGNRLGRMNFEEDVNTYFGRSEKYCMLSLFKRDNLVYESQLVVDWLECNAAQREDDVHFAESTIGWENTLHQLKSKATIVFEASRKIVEHLHPDAQHYEMLPLHDLDMEDEKRLCQRIFNEIRSGKLSEAQKLCCHCGHSWRAALLEGWKLHHNPNLEDPFATEFETNEDESMDTNDKYKPIEGNPNRDIWKRSAWQYCKKETLNPYEKASMAAYSGNLDCLLNVCQNWEDFLWAYMRVMIDIRVESEVRENVSSDYKSMPEQYWEQKMSINEIFRSLESSKHSKIQKESTLPEHKIQKYLILDDIEKLTEAVMDWIMDDTITTQFLRFLTHFMLFLEQIGQINNREIVEKVIEEYIKRLVEIKETQLIAFYVSKLNESMQVHIYSCYLENIVESDARKEALTYAEHFELNVSAITKQVVENIRDKHEDLQTDADLQQKITQFDEYKISSLDWLIFYENQLSDCLIQANALIFMFLTLRKIDAAQLAFNKIPMDVINKLTIDGEAPEHLEQNIKEYLSYKAYLDAQDVFNVWFKNFKAKPVEPERPPNSAAFTEKVAFEHRVSQYNAELGRWKLTTNQAAKLAKTALYNVLLFPKGGWLQGSRDAFYLQSTCIPECMLLLYTVLFDMEQLEECVQLADILVSEKYKIYKFYPKEKLGEIFIKLSICSGELLAKKKDPWGNEMSA